MLSFFLRFIFTTILLALATILVSADDIQDGTHNRNLLSDPAGIARFRAIHKLNYWWVEREILEVVPPLRFATRYDSPSFLAIATISRRVPISKQYPPTLFEQDYIPRGHFGILFIQVSTCWGISASHYKVWSSWDVMSLYRIVNLLLKVLLTPCDMMPWWMRSTISFHTWQFPMVHISIEIVVSSILAPLSE